MKHQLLILVLVINQLAIQPVRILADDGGWSFPIDVTKFTARSDASEIAVDQRGRLHLVWGSSLESSQPSLDTIYYQMIDHGEWSEPIDILAVPHGTAAIPQGLGIDKNEHLVLLWLKGNGILVSISPLATASNAQSWITTTLENNTNISSAALAVDDKGIYHVVYVRDGGTLVYVHSDDQGISWSEPITVEETPLNRAIRSPAILADKDGRIFATWSYTSEEANWGLTGVAFSRLVDGTNQWELAQIISSEHGHGISNLFVDSKRRMALTWIGALGVGGRYLQWSDDNGATWSSPAVISGSEKIAGASGVVNLVEDSLGQLHAVFSGVGQGADQIWYSKWSETGWTNPLSLSSGLTRSERPSVILASGHQIHVLWYEYESQHLWHSTIDLGTPSMNVEPLVMTESDDSTNLPAQPTSEAPISPNVQRHVTQSIPATIALSSNLGFGKEPPRQGSSAFPLLLGGMSAFLWILLVGVLKYRRIR